MKLPRRLHSWNVTPKEAIELQRNLADRVIATGRLRRPRWIVGADLAFAPDGLHCVAAAVCWDSRSEILVEYHTVVEPVRFPYVPGLLSFREAPAVLSALARLQCDPDVFMFDGQGMAHPRRFGLASHLGVWLDRPSIGCAKTLLVGEHDTLPDAQGSQSPIMDRDECVGMAVRTRERVKPVYVSVGHRLSLSSAVEIVLDSGGGFRVPEPTRLADKLVAREKQALGW